MFFHVGHKGRNRKRDRDGTVWGEWDDICTRESAIGNSRSAAARKNADPPAVDTQIIMIHYDLLTHPEENPRQSQQS
ncbi:hypothetical protein GCM10028786_27540 [Flaviaesturariibacter terrae]